MKIGILGTGNMGTALAQVWARAGHEVRLGSRDPQKAKATAESIGKGASGGTYAEAGAYSDTLLVASPWAVTPEVLQQSGSLAGKVLLDCTNPIAPDYLSLVLGFSTSAAEEIAKWAPDSKVVKAFNHVFVQVITKGSALDGRKASVFYCGDDEGAKKTAAGLIADAGFEAVDAGSLKNARYVEPMAELMVQLGYGLGQGTDIAFALLRR